MKSVGKYQSPCFDVCTFDGVTGWCIGCGRTLAECRQWKKAKTPTLKSITAQLPSRLAKLAARG